MTAEQNPIENLKMENPDLNKNVEENQEHFENVILPQLEEKLLKKFNDGEKAEAIKLYHETFKTKGSVKDPVGFIVQELENRGFFKKAA